MGYQPTLAWAEERVYCRRVSLVSLVMVVGALAYFAGRWWAVAIAPTVGLAIGGVIAGAGGSLHDTPLPFVVAIATVASAGALVVRRRAVSVL
jgi:hypothetical protein